MRRIFIYTIFCLFLGTALKAQQSSFPLPTIPQVLVDPTDRANYLAVHYWDLFDFKDHTLIDKPEITEQGFVNFISIIPYVTETKEAFAVFAKRMMTSPKMAAHLLKLSEHYLFDAFSSVYNEELYLLLIEEWLKYPELTMVQRERLLYHQKEALKNRVNKTAADFSFLLRNGKRMQLKDVKAEYVLLFLNDPECDACNQIKERLMKSDVLTRWKDSGKLKILSVCIEGNTAGWKNLPTPQGWIDGCDDNRCLQEEELYDLRNLPAMYLLDSTRKVLLKNATMDRLEDMLKQLK